MSIEAEIAKGLVALAFRNGPLEDIHAGRTCQACAGDEGVSHITQAEMRDLMKFAVDRLHWFLVRLEQEDSRVVEQMEAYADMFCRRWDEPEPSAMHWPFEDGVPLTGAAPGPSAGG